MVHRLADAVAFDNTGAGRRADFWCENFGDGRLSRSAQAPDRDKLCRFRIKQGSSHLEVGIGFRDKLAAALATFLYLSCGNVSPYRSTHCHEKGQ